jgi:cytochrome P450 family 135
MPSDPKPPGPRSPAAIQTVQLLARPVSYLEGCREHYGGTFALRVLRAGRLVFISDPPSLKSLFAADRINIVAPGRNVVLAPLLGPDSLLLLNGQRHLGRRKLMLPPFHGERMRAYERVMEEATERELATWSLREPFPLQPRMQAITLEVIMQAVFGVTEGRREALRQRLLAILGATRSPLAIGLTMPGVRRLGRFRRVRRTIAETDDLLAAEIATARAQQEREQREDILSLLVSARDEDGEGMSDTELRDQLLTLLLAGHETTATALAWAFDLLFRHPRAMESVRDDLEGGDGEYLDAVIEETLRLRPVVPFVGRQLREPMDLGGRQLPEGSVVMASIYLAHTRDDVFADPYAFRPERFLEESPETYSWIPFGGGARRCIGAAFAQFEMRTVLRMVLSRVALQGASDQPEPIVRRNVTLSPRNGTPAIVERIKARSPVAT